MGFWPEQDHGAAWTTTEYLLANLIDAVQNLTYVTMAVNAKKGAHVEKPKPCYRPGSKPVTAKKQTWADFIREMAALQPPDDRQLSPAPTQQTNSSDGERTPLNIRGLSSG